MVDEPTRLSTSGDHLASTVPLVVIGGSAGGIEALRQVLEGLPPDFNAAVCGVIHIPPTRHSDLPALFKRRSTLPVSTPEDGTPIKPGHVYLAPPDHHLMVVEDTLRVVRGPKENGFRPAVDALFRSAASAPRKRLIGVILSGNLADGVRGARAIKAAGGRVIVQDPSDALFPEMPRRSEMLADFVESPAAISRLLVKLMEEPVPESEATPSEYKGRLTEFTCPECGGVLTEMSDRLTYTCHVGHAFSQESLLAHAHETVEGALWRAIRVLNEHSKLLHTLAGRMRDAQSSYSAARFESRAAEVEQSLAVLKNLLLSSGLLDIAEDDLPAVSQRSPDAE